MLWIILIIAIIIALFIPMPDVFGRDKNRGNGILIESRYSELITFIKAGSIPKVLESTNEKFSIAWITPTTYNFLNFNQKLDYLEINWKFDAKLIWENKIITLTNKWEYFDNQNAEQMAEKILIHMNEAFDKSL